MKAEYFPKEPNDQAWTHAPDWMFALAAFLGKPYQLTPSFVVVTFDNILWIMTREQYIEYKGEHK